MWGIAAQWAKGAPPVPGSSRKMQSPLTHHFSTHWQLTTQKCLGLATATQPPVEPSLSPLPSFTKRITPAGRQQLDQPPLRPIKVGRHWTGQWTSNVHVRERDRVGRLFGPRGGICQETTLAGLFTGRTSPLPRLPRSSPAPGQAGQGRQSSFCRGQFIHCLSREAACGSSRNSRTNGRTSVPPGTRRLSVSLRWSPGHMGAFGYRNRDGAVKSPVEAGQGRAGRTPPGDAIGVPTIGIGGAPSDLQITDYADTNSRTRSASSCISLTSLTLGRRKKKAKPCKTLNHKTRGSVQPWGGACPPPFKERWNEYEDCVNMRVALPNFSVVVVTQITPEAARGEVGGFGVG